MKTLGIWLAASLAAACASHPAPDANSGAAPAPMAEATAQSPDGATATAAVAPSTGAATDSNGMPMIGPTNGNAPTNGNGQSNGNAPTNNAVAASNAAATPAPSPPDNSRVNSRDKDGSTLTPMNQGPSEGDRKITQQIRQAVMKDSSLSFTAKNVKIITVNGKVTLRGPVKTDQERSSIEAAAKSVAGVNQVENLLEAKN